MYIGHHYHLFPHLQVKVAKMVWYTGAYLTVGLSIARWVVVGDVGPVLVVVIEGIVMLTTITVYFQAIQYVKLVMLNLDYSINSKKIDKQFCYR